MSKKKSKVQSREIETVKGTPFTVVKFDDGWKVCLRNNIISPKKFISQDVAINYAMRMDTVDVINSLLILIETK